MKYDDKLRQILAELISFREAHPVKSELNSLQEPIDYSLSFSGKMLRPILCYLSHDLFAEINDDTMYACWAIEYFHNFTLMHDDIMDAADMRRGMESSYKKFGSNQTILSGDAMNIQSYMYLQNLNSDQLPLALLSFNRTAMEVCQGQQLDMDFENMDDVSYTDYISMISQKTAALMALSTELGAITATADNDQIRTMYEFGENLGIAFQLLDDYLDAFGDEDNFGKKKGGDILMRKKTCLYIKTINSLEGDERSDFIKAYNTAQDAELEAVIASMKKYGSDEKVKKEIHDYTDRALVLLDSINTVSDAKQELKALCQSMLQRDF